MGAADYETISQRESGASPTALETGRGELINSPAAQSESRRLISSVSQVVNGGTAPKQIHGSPFGKGARRTDNVRWVTVLLVLNYMIGSGILNTPQTFRDSGIAATTVLYIIACGAVYLGSVSLILAAESTSSEGTLEELEFAALAKRTLGHHGGWIVDVSIIVQNFGANCSYVVLVGSLTTSMLREWGGVEGGVHWWESFYVVTPLMVLVLVLPPCLVRHFSNLRWLSAFSLVAIASVVCLVGLGGPAYADAERMSAVGEQLARHTAPLLWWNWVGTFAKLGSVVFALACAPACLHSYSAMSHRTDSEWRAVVKRAVIIGGLLCYGTGLMGYVSFRSATSGDILDNFSGMLASCFKFMVVVHLVMYIPNELVILRHSLFELAQKDVMNAAFGTVAAVTVGILALITSVVTGLMLAGVAQGDLFGYILDLTGGVTASLTSFVLPAMTYLRATKDNMGDADVMWYRKGCRVLGSFGVGIMVSVPAAVMLTALGKS